MPGLAPPLLLSLSNNALAQLLRTCAETLLEKSFMELSSALFTRVASGISRGQAVWALLTLNEYEVDSHLRTALVSRATAALTSLPLSSQTRTALTSGKRLSQFSQKQQNELKNLMHVQRPMVSTVKRFVPSPAVNAALVRNRTSAVRHALVAHGQ